MTGQRAARGSSSSDGAAPSSDAALQEHTADVRIDSRREVAPPDDDGGRRGVAAGDGVPRPSGVEVTEAIRRAGGRITDAARSLGCDPWTVYSALRRGAMWPDGVARPGHRFLTSAEIDSTREAVLAAGGVLSAAAAALNLRRGTLWRRLKSTPSLSSLPVSPEPARRAARATSQADERLIAETRAALDACGWNVAAAARRLGLSRQAVQSRMEHHPRELARGSTPSAPANRLPTPPDTTAAPRHA